MVAQYIDPLNLKFILINTLAGSQPIFTFLFFIAISVLAGMFKMPNQVYLIMIGLATIMLQGWFGSGFYLITVLLAGMISFWAISKLVKT